MRRLARQRSRGWRAVGTVRAKPLLYVPAAVTYMQLRRKLGAPRPLSVAIAYGAPVAVARAFPEGRARAAGVWLAHMWAYKNAYEVPYDQPEKLRSRLRIDPPIAVDRALGLGTPPGQRLQRRLRRPPRLTALDKAMTAIYALWELEPHVVLGWILWRHPGRYPAAAVRLGASFDATLLGYVLVPTAPPWWASEKEGRMGGEVTRVTVEVLRALRGKPPMDDHSTGSNPWASMPSDHFATVVATAIALAEVDRRAGTIGSAYALALGAALVYSGEHYVIDLLAGLALALTVHGAGKLLTGPLLRSLELLTAPGPLRERLRR